MKKREEYIYWFESGTMLMSIIVDNGISIEND